MTATSYTYTPTGSTQTFTAPATLLNGSIGVDVLGAAGSSPGGNSGAGGNGSQVSAQLSASPGQAFTIYVGTTSGWGLHSGGAGGSGGESPGYPGGNGGGSSAIETEGVVLIEAGAGGGGGGAGGAGSHPNNGGSGGNGGVAPQPGAAGQNISYGANFGTGGACGFTSAGVGGNAYAYSPDGGGGGGGGGLLCGSGGQGANANSAGGGGGGGTTGWNSSVSPYYEADGVNGGNGYVNVRATVADPPLVPTLTGPANGSYVDAHAAGVTFAWNYNPGTDSGSQQAYALRFKTGTGSYAYWNAGTGASAGAVVWNSSTAGTATIPAGVLPDGYTWNWSVATSESNYGLQGPFATDQTFNATVQPTVVVTGPGASVTTAMPIVAWSTTLGGGDSQTSWRVVIYTAAQVAAAGFTPGVTTGVADSGVNTGTATSWTVTSALPQGQCSAYVQVTETGGVVSPWTAGSFAVLYDLPATPTVTATGGVDPVTGAPIVTLTVTTHENLLSADDASFETSLGTWVGGGSSTPTRQEVGDDGAWSMAIGAGTYAETGKYSVTGGLTYSAMASFKSDAIGTPGNGAVSIQWFSSTGAALTNTAQTQVTYQPIGWVQATTSGTAPSNATACSVVVFATVAAAYVDEVGLFSTGTPPPWTRGGLVGNETVSIVSSDDGGTTWTPVRYGTDLVVPANTEQISCVDYELIPTVYRQYQAVVTATVTTPVPAVLSSPTVNPQAETWDVTGGTFDHAGTWDTYWTGGLAGIAVNVTSWWLVDPLDPTQSISLVATAFPTARHEQLAVHYPLGSQFPVAIADAVTGQDGSITVQTQSQEEFAAIDAAAKSQRVKWLINPIGEGWYIRLGGASPTQGIAGQVTSNTIVPGTASTPYRNTTYQYMEVARP